MNSERRSIKENAIELAHFHIVVEVAFGTYIQSLSETLICLGEKTRAGCDDKRSGEPDVRDNVHGCLVIRPQDLCQ